MKTYCQKRKDVTVFVDPETSTKCFQTHSEWKNLLVMRGVSQLGLINDTVVN